MPPESANRKNSDGPWCWQSKEIRRLIRDAAGDNHTLKRDTLAVYAALTELASDQQNEEVRASHSIIFDRSGVSVAQVKRALSFLRQSLLIAWNVPNLRAPCIYKLLKYKENTIAQEELTLAPPELAIAQGPFHRSGATPEESEKNGMKNGDEEIPILPPAGGAIAQAPPSPPPLTPATTPAPKPRARNPLIDALATFERIPLAEITRSTGSRLGKALADIHEATPEVTPEEISRRADNYRLTFLNCATTATALAKHWGTCHSRPPTQTPNAAHPRSNSRSYAQTDDYSGVKNK